MKRCYIGVDLGGTTVKLGAMNIEEELVKAWEIPTRTENNGEQILPDIIKAVKEYLAQEDREILALGIGIPGLVDTNGVVLRAVNIHWENVAVKAILEEALGCPVGVANDANIAALGETFKGSAKGFKNAVMVTLGTGVGGGVIVDGKIVGGMHSAGGELGHIPISEESFGQCNCGGQSCLELVASATGIVRLAKKRLEEGRESILSHQEITAKAIFDALNQKDQLAIDTVNEFAAHLGRGLAIIATVVDPEIFILGGGVSKAGESLVNVVKEKYRQYAFLGTKDTDIIIAKLGNEAGTWGGCKLASDLYHSY